MRFLMKPLSPSAKLTHFLILSFSPPNVDKAAPNSSQGRICINLIKVAQIIGIDSHIAPSSKPLVLGFAWTPAGEESDRVSLHSQWKMSPHRR